MDAAAPRPRPLPGRAARLESCRGRPGPKVLTRAAGAHCTRDATESRNCGPPKAFTLTDSVVLRKYLHLKGKSVSPANIALVNKHSESKIISFNSCSVPGAGSLCETVRTSWCPPEALMLEENVKGGGFSYTACATGTLDPSGCGEAPRSPTQSLKTPIACM